MQQRHISNELLVWVLLSCSFVLVGIILEVSNTPTLIAALGSMGVVYILCRLLQRVGEGFAYLITLVLLTVFSLPGVIQMLAFSFSLNTVGKGVIAIGSLMGGAVVAFGWLLIIFVLLTFLHKLTWFFERTILDRFSGMVRKEKRKNSSNRLVDSNNEELEFHEFVDSGTTYLTK
jgi:hypothetical protein